MMQTVPAWLSGLNGAFVRIEPIDFTTLQREYGFGCPTIFMHNAPKKFLSLMHLCGHPMGSP